MRDSSDFISKKVQVTTRTETKITGDLVTIEENGILVRGEDEDSDGNLKYVYYFIPSDSVDHLIYDPEGDY